MPMDPRQDIAATLAARNAAMQQRRQAAIPAPAQRPFDPATGGYLPSPPRQGAPMPPAGAMGPSGPPIPPAGAMGPGGPPMPGGGGVMAGKGPGAGPMPPGPGATGADPLKTLAAQQSARNEGRNQGAVYDSPMSGTPAYSMKGPPPPGGPGMQPKTSAAQMPGMAAGAGAQ